MDFALRGPDRNMYSARAMRWDDWLGRAVPVWSFYAGVQAGFWRSVTVTYKAAARMVRTWNWVSSPRRQVPWTSNWPNILVERAT